MQSGGVDRRHVAVISVPLSGSGDDRVSVAALRTLRSKVIPATLAGAAGIEAVAVGGNTASSVDYSNTLASHTPLVFAFVLGLAFLLLLVTFRSIVIALKAIVLNLLSVGAAYGILVAVFQQGWGASSTRRAASWSPAGALRRRWWRRAVRRRRGRCRSLSSRPG